MTHAEMVEEVIKLHEWVTHWSQRAEAAEAKLGAIQAANVLHDAQLAEAKSRLAHTQAGLTIWMERSKANASELDEAYDAMCEIAKTLDCAEDWAAIKSKLAEAQKEGEMYAWGNERNDRYNQACRDIAAEIRRGK
tara:strand:- start:154 stop:561 length:408 start_codon:yes stop_codon:yes gene_type:complete